jgi:hypothetical protein
MRGCSLVALFGLAASQDLACTRGVPSDDKMVWCVRSCGTWSTALQHHSGSGAASCVAGALHHAALALRAAIIVITACTVAFTRCRGSFLFGAGYGVYADQHWSAGVTVSLWRAWRRSGHRRRSTTLAVVLLPALQARKL